MAPKSSSSSTTTTTTTTSCSISSLFLTFTLLFSLSLFLFFLSSNSTLHLYSQPQLQPSPPINNLKIYLADLPRSLNYGLLQTYWSSSTPDARVTSNDDDAAAIRSNFNHYSLQQHPPYPENPLIKQYSAEYWLLGDLMTPEEVKRNASVAVRVFDWRDADVVFVPFFATLSAEMELGRGKGTFRKKEGNEDYGRQRMVMDLVKGSEAWKRSGGRDHVFVLTGYVKI